MSTRWYLYVCGDLTLISDDPGVSYAWECVAAGTEDAMEAAARLHAA